VNKRGSNKNTVRKEFLDRKEKRNKITLRQKKREN